MEDTYYILGPKTDFTDAESFYKPFMDFYSAAEELKINLRYPIGGYYNDFETFLKTPSQPSHFLSLDPLGNSKRAAGQYLVGYNRGYYGEFDDLNQRMSAYIEENRLTVSGPLYVLYLFDEICIEDPAQYLAMVCVAVSKSKR